ncbi:MAG TPA: phage tail tape measure protein, partial [Ktedonobacteraceae bacterium]
TLAIDAGVAPQKLTDGLYSVISAGYQGRDAMTVLTLATEDSKIGMTSAAIASDALTRVLNGFGLSAKDATRFNGEMLETTTLGQMQFSDYAGVVARASSAAVQYHQSLESMNAALATLTMSGLNAKQAQVDYSQSMTVMYGNIGTVTKSLHANGIAFDETAFNSMNYGQKVEYLQQALEVAAQKHVKITGVTKQASEAIQKISQHIGAYTSDLSTLSNSQAMAQATQQKWATTQAGFNQSMSRLGAAVQVLMINLDSTLLPVLTHVAQAVTPVVAAFTSWVFSGHALDGVMRAIHPVIVALAPVFQQIGSLLIANLVPAWKQLQPAIKDVMPVLQALGALLGGVLVTVLGVIISLVAGLAKGIAMALPGIAQMIAGLIQMFSGFFNIIIGIGSVFRDLFTGNFKKIGADLAQIWTGIQQVSQGFWNTMKGLFSGVVGFIVGLVSGFVSTIIGFFKGLSDALVGHSIIPDMINAIVNVFAQMPGRVMAFVNTMISQVIGGFNNLAGSALQAGSNIINNVAAGIRNAIGAVGSAIGDVTSFISAHLPHSPAKIGPLVDLVKQGSLISQQISQGMLQGMPTIQTSMNTLLAPVAAPASAGVPLQGVGSRGTHTVIYAPVINLSTMARSPSEVQNLVDLMEQEMARRFRTQTSGYAAGGIF